MQHGQSEVKEVAGNVKYYPISFLGVCVNDDESTKKSKLFNYHGASADKDGLELLAAESTVYETIWLVVHKYNEDHDIEMLKISRICFEEYKDGSAKAMLYFHDNRYYHLHLSDFTEPSKITELWKYRGAVRSIAENIT